MGGINVVLFAVLCSANSLSCIDISTAELRFSSPAECQRHLEHTLAILENADRDYPRAMGRCRYMLPPEQGAGAEGDGRYADRLQQAFQLEPAARMDKEDLEKIKAAARKADRIPVVSDCGRQTWPDISWQCFIGQADRQSARPVRTVTVERREGDNTSVLLRVPPERHSAQR